MDGTEGEDGEEGAEEGEQLGEWQVEMGGVPPGVGGGEHEGNAQEGREDCEET